MSDEWDEGEYLAMQQELKTHLKNPQEVYLLSADLPLLLHLLDNMCPNRRTEGVRCSAR